MLQTILGLCKEAGAPSQRYRERFALTSFVTLVILAGAKICYLANSVGRCHRRQLRHWQLAGGWTTRRSSTIRPVFRFRWNSKMVGCWWVLVSTILGSQKGTDHVQNSSDSFCAAEGGSCPSASFRERTGLSKRGGPFHLKSGSAWFRPTDSDLKRLAEQFSNSSNARACNVSETTVRKWLDRAGIRREAEFQHNTGQISKSDISALRKNAKKRRSRTAKRSKSRLTPARVGRIISKIGKAADIVVQQDDDRTGRRKKFASAHDLCRGCAQRLINAGVSAETFKVIMRHSNFTTTEKHYGATRSAQSAARELVERLENAKITPLVGGLMGGTKEAPQLTTKELQKLTSLLETL